MFTTVQSTILHFVLLRNSIWGSRFFICIVCVLIVFAYRVMLSPLCLLWLFCSTFVFNTDILLIINHSNSTFYCTRIGILNPFIFDIFTIFFCEQCISLGFIVFRRITLFILIAQVFLQLEPMVAF
jgi:hypothetical protein